MSTEPYSRKNPYPAPLKVNRKLCGDGSVKDTRHFELDLTGSGVTFECGDSLGVYPVNDPDYVTELLGVIGCDGEEAVTTPDGEETSLRQALERQFTITGASRKFISDFAERANDFHLKSLLQPEMKGEFQAFVESREIIDLFHAFPQVKYSAADFVGVLSKLAPRLYSIASSLKMHPEQVHLTVARVEYEMGGRRRKGVCSTYLSDRVAADGPVKVFVHNAKGFKPPVDDSLPMIMVGPGTGIAPFRAFLQDRRAKGATGKNWVFFGNPYRATDYFYEDEFTQYLNEGVLTKIDVAWSRDQAQKVYVQHLIQQNAAEIWQWLQDGATFYVCGDALKMAGDVDAALHQLIQVHGGYSEEGAAEFVKAMKHDKRYQRDVY